MPFTMYGGELKELTVKEEPITAEMYNKIDQEIQRPIEVSDIKLWDIEEKMDGKSIFFLEKILEEHSEVESVEISNCALILSATTQANFIQNMRGIRRLYLNTYKHKESNYLGVDEYEKIIQGNVCLTNLDLWLDADEMFSLLPAINSCASLKKLKIMGTPKNISWCCAELKKNQSIETLWIKSAGVIIGVDEATALLDLIRHNQYIKYLNLSELCTLTIPAAEMFIAFLKDNRQLMIDYYALEGDEKLVEKTTKELAFYNFRNLFISKVSLELEEALNIFQGKIPGSLQQVFEHIEKIEDTFAKQQDDRLLQEVTYLYNRCDTLRVKIYTQLQQERDELVALRQKDELKNQLAKVKINKRRHSDSSALEALQARYARKAAKKLKLNEEENQAQKQEISPDELFKFE